MLRPQVLLLPSAAACVELPRRLSAMGTALAGLLAFTVRGFAEALAAPALLSRGVALWRGTHAALAAESLLDACPDLWPGPGLPHAPVARALARTIEALRSAAIPQARLTALATDARFAPADGRRLAAVADAYACFCRTLAGRFADRAIVLETAAARLGEVDWLRGSPVLVAGELEPDPAERRFLEQLTRTVRVRRMATSLPPGLASGSFAEWATAQGLPVTDAAETLLAPLHVATAPLPAGLVRLRERLFGPPQGDAVTGDAVELVTATGEAAEVRALARRLLREAGRGVLFEDMAVLLPRPDQYAPLVTDLCERVGIPFRLHPSLPLRCGRSARALLLLLACRGLTRSAVMEFLSFAAVPFDDLVGPDSAADPACWERISREAGVVSGLERWILGLRAYSEWKREASETEGAAAAHAAAATCSREADALLRVVELLSATLDMLSGEATWPEWSRRLVAVCDQWITPGRGRQETAEHEALRDVLVDLANLAALEGCASAERVEQVLAARLDAERLPAERPTTGAVHVGAFDALAGLPFRVVAIPGLVEGGYPPALRPDPFLLDDERLALAEQRRPAAVAGHGRRAPARQLALFDAPWPADSTPSAAATPLLPTTQERLLAERRAFFYATRQATERLILSYPRADERTGRERLPSLFFVAAASALAGRALAATELAALTREDAPDATPLELAIDRSERDRLRLRRGGAAAPTAIAAGCVFFDRSRRAARARWSARLTPYDGLVGGTDETLVSRLDPTRAAQPVSATRLEAFTRCGFAYFLRYVLHLDVTAEPLERLRLDPVERGNLFHRVAERFLRERRAHGELPLSERPETLARLRALAGATLDEFVASQPPRFAALWQRERARFQEDLAAWLGREIAGGGQAVPIHFEVSFGRPGPTAADEPHLSAPVAVGLGDGRVLRVEGRIDRVDRRVAGGLIVRDYKTGKAPKDDGQLQIPFYVLAAAQLFPGQKIAAAVLDCVDAGRTVTFDPEEVTGQGFRQRVREIVDAIADGLFVQDPAGCGRCDFVEVCGSPALIALRCQRKQHDPRMQRVQSLREAP